MARKMSALQQRYFGKGHKAIRGRKSSRSLRSGGRGKKRYDPKDKRMETTAQMKAEGEL